MGPTGSQRPYHPQGHCACFVSELSALPVPKTEEENDSMVVSGVAVLTGLTRIKDPYANFKDPFKGSSWNGNALSTAMVSL